MFPGLGSITAGDIPGNVGNGGDAAPSGADGFATGTNTLGGISFGGMKKQDWFILGGFILAGIVVWKKS